MSRKFELPNSDDSDPMGWIACAVKFFEVQQTKISLKVQLTFVSKVGSALQWFHFLRKMLDLTWEELMMAIIQRLGEEI